MLRCFLALWVATLMVLSTLNSPACAQAEQSREPSASPTAVATKASGPAAVVGGAIEPDYLYPWVVAFHGNLNCGGVLIHPQWVLTAAHCVIWGEVAIGGDVTYTRTDPATNVRTTSGRKTAIQSNGFSAAYKHPDYSNSSFIADIALIKLATPFEILPGIQVVSLPTSPRSPGVVGALARNYSHTTVLLEGQVAVFRAPLPAEAYPPQFRIRGENAGAAVCPGDSGSGFVTVENGRATVRGVISAGTLTDCMQVGGTEAIFVDVYHYRTWILQTIQMSTATLTGNTRLRRVGRAARGVMGIGCVNPYGTMWGPMNVSGVEVGANCAVQNSQGVICSLNSQQSHPKVIPPPRIVGFTVRTTIASGATTVRLLPFSSRLAAFYETLPAGVKREFICKIGPGWVDPEVLESKPP